MHIAFLTCVYDDKKPLLYHDMNLQDSQQVMEAFGEVMPSGATPLGSRLQQLLQEYMRDLKIARSAGPYKTVKPVNYLIITDGEPCTSMCYRNMTLY